MNSVHFLLQYSYCSVTSFFHYFAVLCISVVFWPIKLPQQIIKMLHQMIKNYPLNPKTYRQFKWHDIFKNPQTNPSIRQ